MGKKASACSQRCLFMETSDFAGGAVVAALKRFERQLSRTAGPVAVKGEHRAGGIHHFPRGWGNIGYMTLFLSAEAPRLSPDWRSTLKLANDSAIVSTSLALTRS